MGGFSVTGRLFRVKVTEILPSAVAGGGVAKVGTGVAWRAAGLPARQQTAQQWPSGRRRGHLVGDFSVTGHVFYVKVTEMLPGAVAGGGVAKVGTGVARWATDRPAVARN